MCQTNLISDKIVKLTTRTLKQKLEAVRPEGLNIHKLARLNSDLDSFYDFFYSQYPSITESDYSVFGGQLNIMLHELKDLMKEEREDKSCDAKKTKDQFVKLKNLYSALYEINSDIVNFKINLKKDLEIHGLMSKASTLSRKIVG